ncbi:MBL fold metallo-hydrolase [Heyndrickxia acidicola]|uniref:MBL fold metallo-hydrolase n=1 Tax=Heyndrickxia acidicola TaxID=209389 RepID=A0ABU6MFB5_9BACI|nr:MBL fold metallo-hydrolase [Heyndrickxia acidicola]MED1201735.1 MBL fold metallo-hydrolase [Heyndrickxia acidicola]
MKIEQISKHIWTLKSWMGFTIQVWLVADDNGLTLIDAGVSSMAKGILKSINDIQAGPLQRIILTHGHGDHVGAVKTILSKINVPVYAHSIEIPYIEGNLPYPGRKKAVELLAPSITQPLSADNEGRLQPIGSLTPYFTPGHSPGHVAYYHEEDEVLLAGDLFTSKKGKLRKPIPMFTADMREALKSSEVLRVLKPKRLEICHSSAVLNPEAQLDEYLEKNRS